MVYSVVSCLSLDGLRCFLVDFTCNCWWVLVSWVGGLSDLAFWLLVWVVLELFGGVVVVW